MAIYRFSTDHVVPIISHIPTYKGMVIESLTPDGEDYILQVNIPIPVEEYDHLNIGYGLVEVTQ